MKTEHFSESSTFITSGEAVEWVRDMIEKHAPDAVSVVITPVVRESLSNRKVIYTATVRGVIESSPDS